MKRILLFSGKGGVGKTTVAAATGVAAARAGHRVLVLSFDIAHSLADVFGSDRKLFDQANGRPVEVTAGLEIQEIDVQEEIETRWQEAGNAFSILLEASGVRDVAPEDLALMPGMEDLVTLLYLNQNARNTCYDVLILDCPPTADSLRFVSLPRTIDWYLRKRFGAHMTDMPARGLGELREGISGVEKILHDTALTSVRLVATPESMVLRETQRAYMYFNFYGLVTDMLIINRVFPKAGPIAAWRRSQEPVLTRMREIFDSIGIVELPFHREEILGTGRLQQLADELYEKSDPIAAKLSQPPFTLDESTANPRICVAMPFAGRDEVKLHREDDCLIVRVGSFKRHIPLPGNLRKADVTKATMSDGNLTVTFRSTMTA